MQGIISDSKGAAFRKHPFREAAPFLCLSEIFHQRRHLSVLQRRHARAFTELTDEMRAYVEKAAKLLDVSLVGVDFVFHQGKPYLNEIEDAVGTRMLYQFTPIQIVEEYMDLILEKMKE